MKEVPKETITQGCRCSQLQGFQAPAPGHAPGCDLSALLPDFTRMHDSMSRWQSPSPSPGLCMTCRGFRSAAPYCPAGRRLQGGNRPWLVAGLPLLQRELVRFLDPCTSFGNGKIYLHEMSF